jgi:mutual gliding-motility protein MglA
MPIINNVTKEILLKIVYYGPGFAGKTTNLKFLHKALPPQKVGELVKLDTDQERTLFFDFLPVELGTIFNFQIRMSLFTVPGQDFYARSRELVLRNADGVVFVADSQVDRRNDNVESLESLEDNLRQQGSNLAETPLVLQYNKRDLQNILDLETLDKELNRYQSKTFEAMATTGEGVFPTLRTISDLVLKGLTQ